jgi:hypothetical protein
MGHEIESISGKTERRYRVDLAKFGIFLCPLIITTTGWNANHDQIVNRPNANARQDCQYPCLLSNEIYNEIYQMLTS